MRTGSESGGSVENESNDLGDSAASNSREGSNSEADNNAQPPENIIRRPRGVRTKRYALSSRNFDYFCLPLQFGRGFLCFFCLAAVL